MFTDTFDVRSAYNHHMILYNIHEEGNGNDDVFPFRFCYMLFGWPKAELLCNLIINSYVSFFILLYKRNKMTVV